MIGLCKRFGPGVLPSQARREDSRTLRLLHVYDLGHREEDGEKQKGGEV